MLKNIGNNLIISNKRYGSIYIIFPHNGNSFSLTDFRFTIYLFLDFLFFVIHQSFSLCTVFYISLVSLIDIVNGTVIIREKGDFISGKIKKVKGVKYMATGTRLWIVSTK